jgi:outer membrane immunogenic protein
MRGRVIATATLVAMSGSVVSSHAQDAFRTWTGCYVGGHVGGLWMDEGWVNRTEGGAFFNEFLGGHESSGWLGGVQAGCDYQFAGGFVIGVQGDYAWTDAEGSHPSAKETGVFYHSKADSVATITGRVGYAWNRFLVYAKAGGAWEGDDYWATTLMLGTAYTSHDTRAGWTVGVGGEYAFTNFLSAFVEYNHYDFGTSEIGFTPQVEGLRPAFVDIEETKGILRVGLNLRFN